MFVNLCPIHDTEKILSSHFGQSTNFVGLYLIIIRSYDSYCSWMVCMLWYVLYDPAFEVFSKQLINVKAPLFRHNIPNCYIDFACVMVLSDIFSASESLETPPTPHQTALWSLCWFICFINSYNIRW